MKRREFLKSMAVIPLFGTSLFVDDSSEKQSRCGAWGLCDIQWDGKRKFVVSQQQCINDFARHACELYPLHTSSQAWIGLFLADKQLCIQAVKQIEQHIYHNAFHSKPIFYGLPFFRERSCDVMWAKPSKLSICQNNFKVNEHNWCVNMFGKSEKPATFSVRRQKTLM